MQAGGQRVPIRCAVASDGGQKIDAGEALEGLGHGEALRLLEGIGLAAAEGEGARAGGLGRESRGSRRNRFISAS